MIRIEGLTKSYGSKSVLKGIDLTLSPGTVYGVVGENGAGKTTLFKCIAGLEDHGGEIAHEFDNLKNQMGFLPTIPFFFPKMTGGEYLRLLCHARGLPIPKFLEKNIFDLPLGEYAETYSTGMKKKLALTGILLLENQFYILDEPFNGVDIQSNLIITEIIRRLRALNKTILIASHIFSTLDDSCDELYLLQAGQLVKKVEKDGFAALEAEMKAVTIGDRIDQLGLK